MVNTVLSRTRSPNQHRLSLITTPKRTLKPTPNQDQSISNLLTLNLPPTPNTKPGPPLAAMNLGKKSPSTTTPLEKPTASEVDIFSSLDPVKRLGNQTDDADDNLLNIYCLFFGN